jgi:hypothetical protein
MATAVPKIEFLPGVQHPQQQTEATVPVDSPVPTLKLAALHVPRQPRIPAEYRELTVDEIATLAPVFDAQGAEMPPLTVSQYFGAVKAGRVVGFMVVQAVLHAEPMWIEEGHSEVFKGIVNSVEHSIAQGGGGNVFLFVPKGRMERLAETQQMERYDDTCFFRSVAAAVQEPPSGEPAEEPSDAELIEDTNASAVETSREEVVQDEL